MSAGVRAALARAGIVAVAAMRIRGKGFGEAFMGTTTIG
jgi:hypothetical protein